MPRFVTIRDVDVLFGSHRLNSLIDQFHSFFPGLILDVVPAQAQNAVLGDLAFLVDLESLGDDRSEVDIGIGRPGFEALIDLLFGKLQLYTELNAFLESDLNSVFAVKAVEYGIALPFQPVLLRYLLEI